MARQTEPASSLHRHAAKRGHPHGGPQIPVPKTFEDKQLDMVQAIRDTLLNYTDVVEQQLAGSKPDADQPDAHQEDRSNKLVAGESGRVRAGRRDKKPGRIVFVPGARRIQPLFNENASWSLEK